MKIGVVESAKRLLQGEVVGVPTETVYGLAASIGSPTAIQEIFSLKGRPANNPLIVHLAEGKEVLAFASHVSVDFYPLVERFWPGPLTLVLPVKPYKLPESALAGLSTGAFRVPSHPLARELIKLSGPLVMPSANLSGKPSATCADHVEHDFGVQFPVLDGGACACGVESTILYWQEGLKLWQVARLGAIEPAAFQDVLKYIPEVGAVAEASGEERGQKHVRPLCPGQMYRHYAPKASLLLVHVIPGGTHGVVIGFEDRAYPLGSQLISLGKSTDPLCALQRLYAILRRLDLDGIDVAWVDIDFPSDGLWLTLKERLLKASS